MKMPMENSTFRWTEAYSVHIAALDQQHQQLFETVNELDQSLREGRGSAAIDGVLNKLLDYAEVHFTAEESLMQRHEFPGLSIHRAQHQEFCRKVAAFIEAQRAGKSGTPVSLLWFLREWLKQHVLKNDKRYSAYLNGRGVH
jgi:hemerythrin